MTILTRMSVCCGKHGGMCAWVAVWVYVMCVSCDSLDVYEFVDVCSTHLCAVCASVVCVTLLSCGSVVRVPGSACGSV